MDMTDQATVLAECLESTDYLDWKHPAIKSKADELTDGCATDKEKLEKIYYYSREYPYDIYESFKYLADGKYRASDAMAAGYAFCMGKASIFVTLCRAVGIPSRIGFQQVNCPEKDFMNDEVKAVWTDRPLPWHSLGEAYLNGKWLKLDATIPTDMANDKGKPHTHEFDGENDIPTVEGPIVKDLGSFPDYPEDVAKWYVEMAQDCIETVENARSSKVKDDDEFWAGPEKILAAGE
jgi:transglutaminase-like putative cysteine protease